MTYQTLQDSNTLSLEPGHKDWAQPLFKWKGKRITYTFVLKSIKKVMSRMGLDTRFLGTHSFRSGATTAALARGCPMWLVKRQGGWVSEAINAYFIPRLDELTRASASMGLGPTIMGR